MDDPLTGEMVRWHAQSCGWCRGWGFLIDVEEDGAAHAVRDLAGRRALPGAYAVTVRRPPRRGDRFADGQMIGCGACDETGRTAHPTTACTPACAARLARPPAPPEQAPVCATCGLSWVTRDADDTHCPECATIVGSAADAVTDATP